MNHRIFGGRSMPLRQWAAWSGFCAGIGLLLFLLLSTGNRGIPGWQPVNGSLRATLAANGEAASVPTAIPSAATEFPPASTPDPAFVPAASASLPSSSPSLPIASPDAAGLLALNAATAAELDGLPGIGPAKAQAILDYRDAHNGFRTVEELLQVKGIGPKMYERIRSLVTIGGSAGHDP